MIEVKYADRWEKVKLFTLFDENKNKNTDFSVDHALQFYFGTIIPKKKYELTSDLIETYKKYTIVQSGDIVINGLNLNYDFVSQRVGYVTESGIITSAYISLRSRKNLNTKYYCYLFKAMDAHKMFHGMGTGIRLTLSYKDLQSFKLPAPPLEEQDKIVNFIDWKISEINRLINIKHKEIKTLKELMYAEIEKQLIVYPIVKTVRLKQAGSFFKGGGFSRDNLTDNYKTCPAILYGDIYTQYEYKTSKITHYIDVDSYEMSQKITKGDIVMAGTGETKDEIGKPILYTGNEKVAVGGDVIVFSPHDNVNAEYILYQLYRQSSLNHRYINGKGDIIVHIYKTALGNTMISFPSMENQKKAVVAINKIINSIHEITDKLEQEISVLKELKNRIISDVVTGKIDVRNIEIPDYEPTTEQEYET